MVLCLDQVQVQYCVVVGFVCEEMYVEVMVEVEQCECCGQDWE